MSIPVHRNGDSRSCGASNIVVGQNFVYANGRLISVDGDPDSHGAGNLNARCRNVFINGIMIVNVGDSAAPDKAPHSNPSAASGSPNVFVGD